MADETQELGLDITAQDVTQNAFASVNAGMDGVVGKAGEVKDAAEGMGIQSVAHIGHMAHGFENLGATMEGGSISMRSLAAVVQGGMAAIESSTAMATLGLSLLVALVIGGIEKIRSFFEEEKVHSEEAAAETISFIKQAADSQIAIEAAMGNTLQAAKDTLYQEGNAKLQANLDAQAKLKGSSNAFDLMELHILKDAEEKLVQEYSLKINNLDKADANKKTADALALKNKTIASEEEEFKAITDIKMRENTATMSADDAALANQNLKQQLELSSLKASHDQGLISDADYYARKKALQSVDDQETVALVVKQGKAIDDAAKAAEDKKQKDQDTAYDKMMKRASENEELIAEQLDEYNKKKVDDAEKYNKKMSSEMEGLFTEIGSSIGGGLNKGAAGLKDAMKQVLDTALSFVEKYVITMEAGELAGGWWNPGVWAEIAVTAAAFEAAKSAVGSFQTPSGGQRTVPGGVNMAVPIIAHGGEQIGRGSGDTDGMHLHFHGDYFESESANAQLFNRVYRYQKRTGLRIQPA